MDIKLNDQKLVKVVYRLNDETTLEFNYNDGELTSVTTSNTTNCNVLTDHEMIEKIKSSNFMDELNDAKTKYKIAKEIFDKIKEKYEDKEPNRNEKQISQKSLSLARKLIKMDEDGILDEIVKKHCGKISNSLKFDYDKDAKQMDIWTCKKSIDKIKKDVINMLSTLKKDDDCNKFWDVVETYQDYLSKEKNLSDELWKERVIPITEEEEKINELKLAKIESDANKKIEELKKLKEDTISSMKNIVPDFETTQVLMELEKNGYFDKVKGFKNEADKIKYKAKEMIKAIDIIKKMKEKENE